MEADIKNRTIWLKALSCFCSNQKQITRFSDKRQDIELNLNEFLRNEKKFYSLFRQSYIEKQFRILSAKKSQLTGKSKRQFFKFNVYETFIYYLVYENLKKDISDIESVRAYGRKGAGLNKALLDIKTFLKSSKNRRIWIIRRDIKDFGMSIPHDQLLSAMKQKLNLTDLDLSLIRSLLEFEFLDLDGKTRINIKGAPTGTSLQQLVNGFYLSELDSWATKESDYYIRYGDDILIACYEESKHKKLVKDLDSEINKLGLKINTSKSLEFEFKHAALKNNKDVRYLNYLGRDLDRQGKSILTEIVYKKIKLQIESELKKTERLIRDFSADKRIKILCRAASELVRAQFFSSDSLSSHHLLKIDCPERLKKFDNWLAIKVLQIGLKKGFKQSNFRFYTPTELRRLGLINVNRWV